MSTRTTIDNLPPSVSIDYANAQTATNTPFYQNISQTTQTPRPQIAVSSPAETSQLESLTGVLGKTHTLATFASPANSLNGQTFTHTVFPGFLEKDKNLVLEKLQTLNHPELNKLSAAINTISELNQMGFDAFNRCRQLQQG